MTKILLSSFLLLICAIASLEACTVPKTKVDFDPTQVSTFFWRGDVWASVDNFSGANNWVLFPGDAPNSSRSKLGQIVLLAGWFASELIIPNVYP